MIENKLNSIENSFNVIIVPSVIAKIMASNKSANTTRCKCCLLTTSLITLLIAFVFALASIFGFLFLPQLINNSIIQWMILSPNNNNRTEIWKKPNIPIYTYYYLFNITNVDQIGPNVKPFLQEVGPYVFRQEIEKINITFNDEENTVQYRQVKRWILDPVKTEAPLDAEIYHINVPLVVLV